jgi:hypothetical protein
MSTLLHFSDAVQVEFQDAGEVTLPRYRLASQ